MCGATGEESKVKQEIREAIAEISNAMAFNECKYYAVLNIKNDTEIPISFYVYKKPDGNQLFHMLILEKYDAAEIKNRSRMIIDILKGKQVLIRRKRKTWKV